MNCSVEEKGGVLAEGGLISRVTTDVASITRVGALLLALFVAFVYISFFFSLSPPPFFSFFLSSLVFSTSYLSSFIPCFSLASSVVCLSRSYSPVALVRLSPLFALCRVFSFLHFTFSLALCFAPHTPCSLPSFSLILLSPSTSSLPFPPLHFHPLAHSSVPFPHPPFSFVLHTTKGYWPLGDSGPLSSQPVQTFYTFENLAAGLYTLSFSSDAMLTGSHKDGIIYTWVNVRFGLLVGNCSSSGLGLGWG